MPAARVLSLVAALAALTRGAAAYERVIESGALVHPSRWRAEVTAPALLLDRATASPAPALEEGFVALAPGAGGGLRVRRAASAPAEGARAAILVLDANERAARALEVELLATDDPRDVVPGAEEEARPSAARVACAASFSTRAGGWRLESASVVPDDPSGVTPTCTVRGAETEATEARGDAAAAAAAAAGTDENHSGENQTLFSFASARLEVALPASTPFVREVTVRAAYPPRDASASGSGSDALLGGGSGSGSSPATLAEEEFFHVPNAPSSQTPPPKVRVARLALASRADATALALAWIQRRATCAATLDADVSSACGELFAAELFHDGGDEADAAAFASANLRLGGEFYATVPPRSPSDEKVASPPFSVAADACCAAVAARDAGECSCAADVVPAFAETVTGGGSDSSVARADRDARRAVDFARRALACGSDANTENNKRVASCADDSALLAVVRASVVEGGARAAPAAASAQSARAAPPPPPPPAAPEVDAYDAFLAWLGEREREGEGASPGKEGVEAPSPTSSRAPSPPAARGVAVAQTPTPTSNAPNASNASNASTSGDFDATSDDSAASARPPPRQVFAANVVYAACAALFVSAVTACVVSCRAARVWGKAAGAAERVAGAIGSAVGAGGGTILVRRRRGLEAGEGGGAAVSIAGSG